MSQILAPFGTRIVARFAFASLTAALLAGCADSSRFVGDPLGNPFKSAATDPAPTGSTGPYDRDMAPPPYRQHTAVVARPLAAPTDMPARRVATYETPAHTSPRLSPAYSAPRTERTATIAAPGGHGSWSAAGGMAIVAANGDTAGVLAQRYNVPTEALLHENGFTSSAQIRPGTRVVIPVYSATARVAEVAAPREYAGRERLAKKIAAREEKIAAREEPREIKRVVVKREAEPEHATMHWVKGPQPRVAEKHRKGEKVGEVIETPARKPAKTAKIEVVREKPARMARVEAIEAHPAKAPRIEATVVPRKAVADPTPTASLPPAEEKVAATAAGGGPEFRWPAHGRIIVGFKSGGSDGINIAVPEGTAVKAAESGVVAYAGSEIKGFGNLVLIRHPNGFVSAYANNGALEVHKGEQVKRGQTIAKSGQSGNVASPQLHFELRKGSTPVDPTHYLAGA